MDTNNIHHALEARAYCEAIKDGINGLCRILDIGDDQFGEMDRLESYKAIFRKADAWQQQYDTFRNRAKLLLIRPYLNKPCERM